MKTTFFFVTLSLVLWLTLGSNEKRGEYDGEEVFEEKLDRDKRDAMPQYGGMHYYFLVIYTKNTIPS